VIVCRYALPAPRRWGEQNAAMPEGSLVDLALSAEDELALRLRIPCIAALNHNVIREPTWTTPLPAAQSSCSGPVMAGRARPSQSSSS
jgi:hypothetical protein